jgi:hypothetical protein
MAIRGLGGKRLNFKWSNIMKRIIRWKLLAFIIAIGALATGVTVMLSETTYQSKYVHTIDITGEGTATRITTHSGPPGQDSENMSQTESNYTFRKVLINGTHSIAVEGDITLDEVKHLYDTVLDDTEPDSRDIFLISADNGNVSVYKGIGSTYGMLNKVVYHYEKRADAWVQTGTVGACL